MMAQNKVQITQDWPELRKVKDIQSFSPTSTIISSTNTQESLFHSRTSHTRMFLGTLPMSVVPPSIHLRIAFTTAPFLTHWIPDTQITVETDASDYVLTAILSITTHSGKLHPIAFHSWMFPSPECNYDVHDKELLVIVEAFTCWRHYLEGSSTPINVITDHQNLQYFSTTKILTHRQACWSEFLSAFNLVIYFHPRKLVTKPDVLTR